MLRNIEVLTDYNLSKASINVLLKYLSCIAIPMHQT